MFFSKNSSFLALLLFSLVSFPSCDMSEDASIQMEEPSTPNQFIELELLLTNLVQSSNGNLSKMKPSDRFMVLAESARINNVTFDYERAVSSYNDAYQYLTLGKETYLSGLELIKQLDDLVATYGFTPELGERLAAFQSVFDAQKDSYDSVNVEMVKGHIDLLLYLSNSEVAQKFASATKQFYTNKDLAVEFRNFPCAEYAILAQAYTALCAIGKIYACPFAVYYWNKYFKCENSGGSGGDPCANSPDPCCGVNCVSGYICINGSCVIDPNDPGCINNGCPPGYVCAQNQCIPI